VAKSRDIKPAIFSSQIFAEFGTGTRKKALKRPIVANRIAEQLKLHPKGSVLFVMRGLVKNMGLKTFAKGLPLSTYHNLSFFIIRNDALDRFGTALEQRFSKSQVETMMQDAGLENVTISPNMPYWHAVGKRVI
jgi:hypothetical protein